MPVKKKPVNAASEELAVQPPEREVSEPLSVTSATVIDHATQSVMPVTASNVSLGTLQASNPQALVSGAAELAGQLAVIIAKQNLATTIKGKRFVNVEGWTTLATMLGVTAREVETIEQDGVYIATVELVRMSDQAVISRASAECGSPDELDKYGKPIWSTRPRYARRSMAQTRATGKACRLAFSWIMSLAGYEVTPAEEMLPVVEAEQAQTQTVVSSTPIPAPVAAKANPTLITTQQHRFLEAKIKDYGLERERIKAWLKKAWQVEHFTELSQSQFERLLSKIETWAGEEYARAEAQAALSAELENAF